MLDPNQNQQIQPVHQNHQPGCPNRVFVFALHLKHYDLWPFDVRFRDVMELLTDLKQRSTILSILINPSSYLLYESI